MISRLRNFYRWASNILRYNGLLGLIWQLIRKIFHPFGDLGLVTFFEKDLIQPLKEVKAGAELTIVKAQESDMEPLIKLIGERYGSMKSSQRREVENRVLCRFQKGSLCFLGKIRNEVIHYAWISFNWDESLAGRFLHLGIDEALYLDAYTVEKWRGQRIHPAVLHQMLYYLKQRGYRKVYALVDTDNKSSKKTHDLLAWTVFGNALGFTPRGASKGWIWRIKGSLAPFLEKKVPDSATNA